MSALAPATRPASAALAARDAVVATAALVAAVYVGSGGFRHLDSALLGYLGAVLVATAGTVYRMSAFWRRPASAVYGRALAAAVKQPAQLRRMLAGAGSDLAAQRFIARRSRPRWIAHLLLSLGTLASCIVALPLVLGWLHFEAAGAADYRAVFFNIPLNSFAVDGPIGWVAFHFLGGTGVAVALGAAYFLAVRFRQSRVPGVTAPAHLVPLLLLLAVALTGLALPASRHAPGMFRVAALAHEITVVILLVALPFSKLGHLLIRPLQLGAKLVRASGAPALACANCGVPLGAAAQHAAVDRLLAARGAHFAIHLRHCQGCRRRLLATAQVELLGAHFNPPLLGTAPAAPAGRAKAA